MLEYGPRPQVPRSEVEVFVGNILGSTGAFTRRQRELSMSMKEHFEDDLSFIVKYILSSTSHSNDGEEGEPHAGRSTESNKKILALSMACLWVGLNESAKVWQSGKRCRVELRSFAYVAAALCLKEVETLVR